MIFVSSRSPVATPSDMINYGVTKIANLAVFPRPLGQAPGGHIL